MRNIKSKLSQQILSSFKTSNGTEPDVISEGKRVVNEEEIDKIYLDLELPIRNYEDSSEAPCIDIKSLVDQMKKTPGRLYGIENSNLSKGKQPYELMG